MEDIFSQSSTIANRHMMMSRSQFFDLGWPLNLQAVLPCLQSQHPTLSHTNMVERKIARGLADVDHDDATEVEWVDLRG